MLSSLLKELFNINQVKIYELFIKNLIKKKLLFLTT